MGHFPGDRSPRDHSSVRRFFGAGRFGVPGLRHHRLSQCILRGVPDLRNRRQVLLVRGVWLLDSSERE